jgi:hypothetical protein
VQTKIVEATNGMNWGKFLVTRFTDEWQRAPALPEAAMSGPLLRQVGWTREHVGVWDLQTGEGALFRPGGHAGADLAKHAIWVCLLYEPFLAWLYAQDLHDLDALPDLVALPDAPRGLYGHRRPGPDAGARAAAARGGRRPAAGATPD